MAAVTGKCGTDIENHVTHLLRRVKVAPPRNNTVVAFLVRQVSIRPDQSLILIVSFGNIHWSVYLTFCLLTTNQLRFHSLFPSQRSQLFHPVGKCRRRFCSLLLLWSVLGYNRFSGKISRGLGQAHPAGQLCQPSCKPEQSENTCSIDLNQPSVKKDTTH